VDKTERQAFDGFAEPKTDYFPVPNTIFAFFHLIQNKKGGWVTPELKIVLFLLKHAWHVPNGLTERQIRHGVRCGRIRDLGTGLDGRTFKKAVQALAEVEAICCQCNGSKMYFKLNYRDHQDRDESSPINNGFPKVNESYFKVPQAFTDLIFGVRSGAAILGTLYLMRHGWGYANPKGCWLEMDEINSGRHRTNGVYDDGVGFDDKTMHRAINKAIHAGLIVWSDRRPDFEKSRVYNLRFTGMECDPETGEFIGQHDWESDHEYENWLSSRGLSHEIPHINRERAHVGSKNAKTHRIKANYHRKFIYPRRKFTYAFRKNDGKFIYKNTLRKTKQKIKQTTTATQDPSLAAVVNRQIGIKKLLAMVGINTVKSQKAAMSSQLSSEDVLAWVFFAWQQPGITNPEGYLMTRCRDGDRPPEEWKNLVCAPIPELIAKIDGVALPPKIAEILEPFYDEETEISTLQIEQADSIDEEAQKIWGELKGDLEILFPKNIYETWIAPSRGISWNGTILTVASANTFAHDALSRLATEITAALESKIRGSEIKFVVAPPTDY